MIASKYTKEEVIYTGWSDYLTSYYAMYYLGLLLSGLLTFCKKNKNIAFSFLMALGTAIYLVEYKLNAKFSFGTALIHFTGGYFEGITPSYCTFS